MSFWGESRAYPNDDIPSDAFSRAYEYSKLSLRQPIAAGAPLDQGAGWQPIGPTNGGGQYSDVVASSPVAPYGPPSAPSVSCELTAKKQKKVSCSWNPGANSGAGAEYEQTDDGGPVFRQPRHIDHQNREHGPREDQLR